MSVAPANPALQQQLLQQLANHLDAELTVQRKLLPIAEARSLALVSGDHQRLGDLLTQEQEPLDAAGRLRGNREKLQRALATAFALPQPTLSAVTKLAPPAIAGQIQARGKELAAVAERLRQAHERNGQLARQAISFVRDLLTVMTGSQANAPIAYDRRGLASSYGQSGRGGLVDCAG